MSRKEQLIRLRDSLRSECVELLRDIQTLEERRAAGSSNVYCPEVEKDVTEYDVHDSKMSYKELKRLIRTTEEIAGIYLSTLDQITTFNEGEKAIVYRGVGRTELLNFDFQLSVSESKAVEMVTVSLHDKKVEELLRPWLREYSRKKDFQHIMKGIKKYSDLLSQMKEMLNSFKSILKEYFNVKFDTTGCDIESKMRSEDTPALTVRWGIAWKEYTKSMENAFTFEISDVDLFSKQEIKLWKEMAMRNELSADEIRIILESVVHSINISGK